MAKFNLEKAKSGEAVETKKGIPVRILIFDRDSRTFPIVAILNNRKVYYYTNDGKFYLDRSSDLDLVMK